MTVEDPRTVKPPDDPSLYVAADALSADACVAQTLPAMKAFAGAVPGAWIVCGSGLSRRISPGASVAQFEAVYCVPAAPAGHAPVIASTPPWAFAGSLPMPRM